MPPWGALAPGLFANLLAGLKIFADTLTNYVGVALAGIVFGFVLEWLRPLEPGQPRAAVRFNLVYMVLASGCLALLRPLTYTASLAVVHYFGGGWIHFPATPLGFAAAVASLLVLTDLLEYLFHRVQHALPWMWAMHELHHSEETYNVTLSYRHYWFEFVLKALLVYPIAGILLNVPTLVSGTVALLFFINHQVAHLNVPLSFGRFAGWLSSPHYHRLHHSREPRHYDKNFCDIFPFWDRLFGTQYMPTAGEYAVIGLLPSRKPATLRAALLWPFVRHARPHARSTAAASAATGLPAQASGVTPTGDR
jgi:sterol desaturase/sphingolipid hydroxylase (fatty acid hydroxylase superfamily)